MIKGQSLQDSFLNDLRKRKIPTAIYLTSGIKLQGQIDSFDQYVVLLKNNITLMIYKHAISTVVPAHGSNPMQHENKHNFDRPFTETYNE